MTPTVILACGALKARVALPAIELYRGPFYDVTRRWAESITTRDRIFIVSALHGFIPSAQVVEPYNVRLDAAQLERLVEPVRWQAARLLEPCTAVGLPWFCGGGPYSDLLDRAGVRHLAVSATLPPGRASRGIGAQRSWYGRHLGELPTAGNG